MADFLNLPDYRILKVEESAHDYHVQSEPVAQQLVCANCTSANIGKWGSREQLIKDLPSHGKCVGIYIDTQRYRCGDCGKTFFHQLPGIAANRQMTERLVNWIGRQSLKRTFLSLADETGVDEKTIRNIFRDYINELERTVRFETPKWMGIDEIHLNKEAVHAVIPEAQIVVDKFHVVKMANAALESVRKSIRGDLNAKQRRGMMHDRFVLLRREHDLSDKDILNLDGWTKNYPLLGDAYRFKEAFYGVYNASTVNDAYAAYECWAKTIPPVLYPHFQPIVTAFGNWMPEILAYFDQPLTNAYTESLSSLRVMDRLGRGYSFEALRTNILFTEGSHAHKQKRLRFERKAEHDRFELELDIPPSDIRFDRVRTFEMDDAHIKALKLPKPTKSTQIEDGEKNYGADISTLVRMIENGEL